MNPGCDLHLIHATVAPIPQRLRILVNVAAQAIDVAGDPRTTYHNLDMTVVGRAGAVFTPLRVGETVTRVTFQETPASPVQQLGHVRIRVHGALRNLQFGNTRVTVRVGSADYVPTVFAEFDDLPLADVTGHDWLTVRVAGSASFSVAAGDHSGRIRVPATSTPGEQNLLFVEAGTMSAMMPVHVAEALSTPRPILNPLRYTGPHTTRRNLLIMGEGFPDEDTFELHATRIIDKLFSSPLNNPYPQLAGHINVWTAYEPPPAGVAPESGITIGPLVNDAGEPLPLLSNRGANLYTVNDVTALVGYPTAGAIPADGTAARAAWSSIPTFDPAWMPDAVFDRWKQQAQRSPLLAKDSRFGLMFGSRPCGPDAPDALAGLPGTHWELFPTASATALHPDPRRVPVHPAFPDFLHPNPSEALGDLFQVYFESLKYGIDATNVDHDVGRTWLRGGADDGLCAILVFEGQSGGTAFGSIDDVTGLSVRTALAWSVGNQKGHTLDRSGHQLDHTVNVTKPAYDVLAANLAHELGHVLGLGDEYEDIYDEGHIDAANVPALEFERYANLMHRSTLFAGANITANTLKWNWDRIALASPVLQVAVPPPGVPDPATLQLEPGQGMKWKLARDRALDVYLRVRELNRTAPGSTYQSPLGPFKLTKLVGDTVELTGPFVSPLTYGPGCVLYLPVTKPAGKLTLVHPAVDADLVNKGPFGVNATINLTAKGESARKDIAGFSKPKNREMVIGAFDGAGTYNTNAFRPSGQCKMREVEFPGTTGLIFKTDITRLRPFCFTCRYILINVIWPGAYDLLDREYPEDC